MSVQVIRRLHEHREWANTRLREAAGHMTDAQLRGQHPCGRGSVFDSLVHLYAGEAIWLAALQGNPTPPGPDDFHFATLDDLTEAWRVLAGQWDAYLAALSESELSRPITKVSTSSGAGRSFTLPEGDVLIHVCTHAQYTTAQCVNMMRREGLAADLLPDTMMISMSREQYG